MAEATNVGTNGSASPEAPVNRVADKPKGKSKPVGRGDRLDALWKRLSNRKFTLRGEVRGEPVNLKSEGFPDDLSPEGVEEFFQENGAIASRKKAVGAASGGGSGEADGETAAEIAKVMMDMPE